MIRTRKTIGATSTLLILFVKFVFISMPTSQMWAFPVQDTTDKSTETDDKDELKDEQKELSDRYKLLEEKLFSLHEYEKGQNPIRSELLKRAFLQSQEKMTTLQLKRVVGLLEKSKLKDAEKEQGVVLKQLNELLELLQSEDRGKRVRDEIKRHQDYLKEVERILRIQKGLRGQAEGGVDARRLANSQNKTADRTNDLSNEIEANEGSSGEGSEGSSSAQGGQPSGDPKDSKESSDDESKDKPKDDDESSSENDQENSDEKDKQDSDSSSKGKPGKGGSGQPGQTGDGESGESSNQQDQQQSDNKVLNRIQAAEKRMRDAQQKLEQAKRDGAIDDMRAAEREMALAKKELEEILRQLREEEIERTLAMLEGRFRIMLERQVNVYESTRKLDRVIPEQRGTDFEIRSGKLSTEQASIAKEADRAMLILLEDGSSVAFPTTVEEMHQDMLQVTDRLAAAKVGRVTIEIEEDIIDTLDYLIEALVKTQQDMERMKQSGQQQGSGQPGDKPLVDKLAEIKMLRGLQERIFRRHRRYSKFLDDPDDPVGSTDDPDLMAALSRLADKQGKLTDIARDILNEKNK